MPADGNLSILSFERARRAGTLPQPVAVISHPMAAAFGFPPLEPVTAPPSRYMPAETLGAVYLGVVRFEAEQVAALLAMFERERAWDLHDQLCAARDGLTPEPPEAA